MRTITARRNAQIALPTMPWRTVVPRETHPRPTVTRARTDHPRLAPALGHRRHAATGCTGTDSPATHLRVHSAPENAPCDALGCSPLSKATSQAWAFSSMSLVALISVLSRLVGLGGTMVRICRPPG